MPRPPPKTSSASWDAQHHRLSDDARKELISLLNLDPTVKPDELETANQALAEVEKWLGFYSGADTVLKNTPKASDFVRSLSSIENDTLKLKDHLGDSHQWIRSEITEYGANLDLLHQELEKLLMAAKSIQAKYESVESRGPPKFEALRHVILKLREIFARYYQDPIEPKWGVVSVQALLEYESAEKDFIKFALDDEGITYPENLRHLLNELNVTLESSRRVEIYDEKNVKRARDKQLKLLKKRKKKEKK